MAIISIMERELVRERKLLSLDEFLHGVGFGQILGSFAVNLSLFVGCRLFGVLGGILSAAVFLLPSLALVIALSDLYFRFHAIPALQGAVAGLGPVVIALIVEAGWSIGRRVLRSPLAIALAVMALAAGVLKINTLWVLLGAGAVGLVMTRRHTDPPEDRQATKQSSLSPLAALAPALAAGSSLGTLAVTFLKVGLGILRRRLRASAGFASPSGYGSSLAERTRVHRRRGNQQSDAWPNRRAGDICRLPSCGNPRRLGCNGGPDDSGGSPDAGHHAANTSAFVMTSVRSAFWPGSIRRSRA